MNMWTVASAAVEKITSPLYGSTLKPSFPST